MSIITQCFKRVSGSQSWSSFDVRRSIHIQMFESTAFIYSIRIEMDWNGNGWIENRQQRGWVIHSDDDQEKWFSCGLYLHFKHVRNIYRPVFISETAIVKVSTKATNTTKPSTIRFLRLQSCSIFKLFVLFFIRINAKRLPGRHIRLQHIQLGCVLCAKPNWEIPLKFISCDRNM